MCFLYRSAARLRHTGASPDLKSIAIAAAVAWSSLCRDAFDLWGQEVERAVFCGYRVFMDTAAVHTWQRLGNSHRRRLCHISALLLNAYRRVRDIRGSLTEQLNYIQSNFGVDWFGFSDSEFSAHFFVSSFVLQTQQDAPLKLGQSYLNGFLNLIPLRIWPDQDREHLALWFAREFDFSAYSSGGGFGYSFVIEAFQNFGYLGSVLVGMALGALANYLERFSKKLPGPSGGAFKAATVGLLVMMPRTEFGDMLKFFIIYVAAPTQLSVFLWRHLSNRRAAPSLPRTGPRQPAPFRPGLADRA